MNEERKFIITGKTNAKTKILWKFTLLDLGIIGLDFVIFGIMIFVMLKMGMGNALGIGLPLGVGLIIAVMVIPINDEMRVYNSVAKMFRYIFRNKKIRATNLSITFNEDGTVKNRNGLLSAIVYVKGKNMMIMSAQKRALWYSTLENTLRIVKNGKIVKWDALKNFDKQIEISGERIKASKDKTRLEGNKLDKAIYEALNDSCITTNAFGFIVYDYSLNALIEKVRYIEENLDGRMLNKDEVREYYNNFYLDFRSEEEKRKDLTNTKSNEETKTNEISVEKKIEEHTEDNMVVGGVSGVSVAEGKEITKKNKTKHDFVLKFFKKIGNLFKKKDKKKVDDKKVDTKPLSKSTTIESKKPEIKKTVVLDDKKNDKPKKKGLLDRLIDKVFHLDNGDSKKTTNVDKSKEKIKLKVSSLNDIKNKENSNIVVGTNSDALSDKEKKSIEKSLKEDDKKELKEIKQAQSFQEKLDNAIRFPKVVEKKNRLLFEYGKSDSEIDRKVEYTYISIYSMPLVVYGCFLAPLFQVKGIYVNVNFNIDEDLDRINKRVNKRINTILTDGEKVKNETQRLKMSEEIEVLSELIKSLNSGVSSTNLLNVDITLRIPSEFKDLIKRVRTLIKLNMSSRPIDNKYEQLDTLMSMLPQNLSCLKSAQIDMTSDTLGGSFPFHTDEFYEPTGDVLGHSENGDYFAFDLFYNLNNKNTQNRTNSNMVIIGKSGAGKSYFSKLILKNYLLQNCKILILDPENEYEYICKKFGGNTLDVSKSNDIKINPFEFVFLNEEDENPFTTHLEFLRQFFKIVISDLSGLAREELDVLTTATYKYKGITSNCDFRKLTSKDFPTFDDLITVAQKRAKQPNLRDSELDALTEISIALEKFKKDGIYGQLWNCYTTFKITNDFTTFNFRGLDNATIVKNATMLLITNMVNKVLIENILLKGKRKLIFMVDEAHTFIDPNFPVALDLMKNMSKRIRKYNGSLITTTQNIQDFVGFDTNTRTKATAVLNNSQYTCLFGLKPNDLEEVKDMYSQGSVGDFTTEEQNYLLTAKRGDALMIIDTDNRVPFHASVKDESEVEYFLPSYQKNN